jgi:DNA helicase-2/ATP-dependent DNA helicase PcrA
MVAVHKALQQHFRARLAGHAFSEEDLVAAFHAGWISEGFLSRQHEEQRMKAGEEALRRFHREDAAQPLTPTAVEQEFGFYVERTKLIGRYDLVVERDARVSVLDFKTSGVDDARAARERAQQSLQLDVYALAYLRTRGRLPDWVELRFLESGLAGGKQPTLAKAAETEALIREVSGLIRRREFRARPSWMACGQCAFRDICPHTARAPELES